ncbi:MAG TPA: acyl-CoA dehydrogenase family protein [Vineibacter terrae]|nr:acyl-CoA dehydrogenase family protein [Vineibacter terrae]HEX2885152.1 acyl-CoA dehydrogenase family protein [Vineibacter terrae]
MSNQMADAGADPFTRFPSLPTDGYATHEVMNQATPLTGHNAFTGDRLLTEIAAREPVGWAAALLAEAGRTVASAHVAALARDANRYAPELRTHDRFGHRIDEIAFHPAWHELMSLAIGHGTHSLAWTAGRPSAHVARGILSYLWNQGESGICCPLGMTYSAIPALRLQPELAAVWEPFIVSTRYDATSAPMQRKTGGTVGMTLTEKQAGSDLRATQTTARPAGPRRGPGEAYIIDGHKWFFSAPQSDLFVTLARTDRGLSCFLLPGWLADGTRNRLLIQRLKDKCGNRSNASSEIEYLGALGWLVGEEGQGIKVALAMTHLTRLDFAIGSAGLMRRALSEAIHHVTSRRAFQKRLIDQPLMQNVVADLALEVEAATLLAFRLARAVDDEQAGDSDAGLLARIGTPVGKFWNCKRAVSVVHEAMECHGGNGFIEDGPMARLYREAPLNGIWEGSGNVIALDVLRAAARSPHSVPVFIEEVRKAKGGDKRLDRMTERLQDELSAPQEHEARARRLVERMAIALQASLLIRQSPPALADAFCATRLGGDGGSVYGSLPAGLDQRAIVERARLTGAAGARDA